MDLDRDHTYVVTRQKDHDSYSEPIYAGSDKRMAMKYCIGSFVVLEYNNLGVYIKTHKEEINRDFTL